MTNLFRTGIMRRGREFTAEIKRNITERDKDLRRYEDMKGSKFYEKTAKEINERFSAKTIQAKKAVQLDWMEALAAMRASAASKITKAPTADVANTLAILDTLDNITPTQLKMYSESMADIPVAMQKLAQIAEKHHMKLTCFSPDIVMEGIDRLEGYLTQYLTHFDGDIDHCTSFVTKDLYRYFQPEDFYAQGVKMDSSALAKTYYSSRELDDLLWQKVVGFGTPETLEENGEKALPVVQYFFNTVEALSDYIERACRGKDSVQSLEIKKDILAACPSEYAFAYDDYATTGNIRDLNTDTKKED